MFMGLVMATLFAAAPGRGLQVSNEVELVTQVEARLADWLVAGGDREVMLATADELRTHFRALGVGAADLAAMVDRAKTEQADHAKLTTFTATRTLVSVKGRDTSLNFFDAEGHRCDVPLATLGPLRYVLLSGPRTDSRSLDDVVNEWKGAGRVKHVFFEKTNGKWVARALPPPPPPGCDALLKKAAKAIFTAEKSYFAEQDRYSNDFEALGIEPKALGIRTLKVSLAATAEHSTFTAELTLGDGLAQVNEAGDITFVTHCTSVNR
jgi:hypothetical protein